jgi:hypothetical protein
MSSSVYIVTNSNDSSFELGESSWASGFPIEVLLEAPATLEEIRRRAPGRYFATEQYVRRVCEFVQTKNFDVYLSEGCESPNCARQVGSFFDEYPPSLDKLRNQ